MRHHTELLFADKFLWVSPLHYLKNGWQRCFFFGVCCKRGRHFYTTTAPSCCIPASYCHLSATLQTMSIIVVNLQDSRAVFRIFIAILRSNLTPLRRCATCNGLLVLFSTAEKMNGEYWWKNPRWPALVLNPGLLRYENPPNNIWTRQNPKCVVLYKGCPFIDWAAYETSSNKYIHIHPNLSTPLAARVPSLSAETNDPASRYDYTPAWIK